MKHNEGLRSLHDASLNLHCFRYFFIHICLLQHPSIYEVVQNGDGSKTFTRIDAVETSPYYRWDNSVLPRTEAFPPGFRMIAHSNDIGAEGQMLTECCNIIRDEEESCSEWDRLHFPPNRKCDFLGIALGEY